MVWTCYCTSFACNLYRHYKDCTNYHSIYCTHAHICVTTFVCKHFISSTFSDPQYCGVLFWQPWIKCVYSRQNLFWIESLEFPGHPSVIHVPCAWLCISYQIKEVYRVESVKVIVIIEVLINPVTLNYPICARFDIQAHIYN